MRIAKLAFVVLTLTSPCFSQVDAAEVPAAEKSDAADRKEPVFQDIPPGHWAAESVSRLQQLGIVEGYPDGRFHGNRVVTRYELAIVLNRMIDAIQAGLKPAVKVEANPVGKTKESESGSRLARDGFIPMDSPLLRDPQKPSTPEEVADAIVSVAAQLVKISVPSMEELPAPDDGEARHD